MCVTVRFSFSDYLLAIMARFCVVVVTAVCCLVTAPMLMTMQVVGRSGLRPVYIQVLKWMPQL